MGYTDTCEYLDQGDRNKYLIHLNHLLHPNHPIHPIDGQEDAMTINELLNMPFDAKSEEEYRRGYLDGFLAALDYVSEGKDIEWLYRFRNQVLTSWSTTDPDKLIEPPQPGYYLETDEGFVQL
jgi:hypothetical protein